MADLSDADAVSEVLTYLRSHPVVLAEFGDATHVSGVEEGPWPHIVVSPGPGGDLGDLRGHITPEVQLEFFGPPDLTIGPAEMWRKAMKVLLALKDMPEQDYVRGRPVVAWVQITGSLNKQDRMSGQLCYSAIAGVTLGIPQ